MSADDSVPLLFFGFEREEEEKIFARWIPVQDAISFEEFKESLTRRSILKSNKEIMADVNSIIMAAKRESDGNI